MRIPFIKLSILIILPFSLLTALEDTKENRIIQAERYLNQFSLVDMIGGTWEQMFKHPPFSSWSDKQKKNFSDRMTAIVTSEDLEKLKEKCNNWKNRPDNYNVIRGANYNNKGEIRGANYNDRGHTNVGDIGWMKHRKKYYNRFWKLPETLDT